MRTYASLCVRARECVGLCACACVPVHVEQFKHERMWLTMWCKQTEVLRLCFARVLLKFYRGKRLMDYVNNDSVTVRKFVRACLEGCTRVCSYRWLNTVAYEFGNRNNTDAHTMTSLLKSTNQSAPLAQRYRVFCVVFWLRFPVAAVKRNWFIYWLSVGKRLVEAAVVNAY